MNIQILFLIDWLIDFGNIVVIKNFLPLQVYCCNL